MDAPSNPVNTSDTATARSKRKPIYKSHGHSLSLPKLKKIKRDLLTDLPLTSHECQSEILPLVQKSFHWRSSGHLYQFKRVQSVHNPELTAKYLEKKRDMKSCGYSDSLVTDSYAFLLVENTSLVEKICQNGVRCGNQKFSGLGVSHMAVHLCKHADVLTPFKLTPGDKICLVVKVLKGKVKSVVCRTVGVQLEPTPNYDSHIAKSNTDPAACLPPQLLFYSLQLYIYEYGDLGVEDYPKQILPYAVVHYSVREPPPVVSPHIANFPPNMTQARAPKTQNGGSRDVSVGPRNEIWKGRLHMKLIGGGHVYIDVSILSHFVPFAITLLSPVKISHTYPNTNAQLTFLAGLSDIATKAEVPWRDYFFRSFVMKPSVSCEGHFKALIRHITSKQEMVAVRLPKDVFLFLLPKCLLASQLGLVQGDYEKPVLYCVLMSKVSTIKKYKHKLENIVGGKVIRKCGKAKRWEELFEDSDSEEQEAQNHQSSNGTTPKLNVSSLGAMFEQQRLVQNRLAAMSLEEANAVFTPCGCGKPPIRAAELLRLRNVDIERVGQNIHHQLSRRQVKKPQFPPGSRTRQKHRVSHRTRTMPSFSPHGSSSESDSDSDITNPNRRHARHSHKSHLSILDDKKTVEEELSEDELTNEQMEAIIFMRKPATTVVAKQSSVIAKKSSAAVKQSSSIPQAPLLPSPQPQTKFSGDVPPESKAAGSHFQESSPPLLLTQPKIIPTEPLDNLESGNTSPTNDGLLTTSPIIIPTEPVSPSPPKPTTPPPPPPEAKAVVTKPKQPKSILKKSVAASSCVVSVPVPSSDLHPLTPTSVKLGENVPPPPSPSHFPLENDMNDMGDVDMRITPGHTTLTTPFISAISSSPCKNAGVDSHDPSRPESTSAELSPSNCWSQGSWLAPGELPPLFKGRQQQQHLPALTDDLSLPHSPSLLSQHELPASPDASPPSNSPPSPGAPWSPGFESLPPNSPPSPDSSPATAEIESPASPPQSGLSSADFRSTPIAIPTVRVIKQGSLLPRCEGFKSQARFSQPPRNMRRKSSHKGEAENADDMMEFLNSAATNFDSDDSPIEDER